MDCDGVAKRREGDAQGGNVDFVNRTDTSKLVELPEKISDSEKKRYRR